jgi:hypothetical protein
MIVAAGVLAGCVDGEQSVRPTAYSFTDSVAAASNEPMRRPLAAERVEAVPGAYVVEFRARAGLDIIGHSYLVFGIMGDDEEIIDPVHTGLYPNDITGFAFAVGGAKATTEAVALDKTIAPTTVYRRTLTPAQYQRLSAAVERARVDPPSWSWTNYNCNTYMADLAREIGLKTPTGGSWMAPTLFVSQLKELNG